MALNQREKNMAIIVCVGLGALGAYFVYDTFYWQQLKKLDADRAKAQKTLHDNTKILENAPKIQAEWDKLAVPTQVDPAAQYVFDVVHNLARNNRFNITNYVASGG